MKRIKLSPPDEAKILEIEKPDGSILPLRLRKVTVDERRIIENESLESIRELQGSQIGGTEFNLRFLEKWVEGFKREWVSGLDENHLTQIMHGINELLNPKQTQSEKKSPA